MSKSEKKVFLNNMSVLHDTVEFIRYEKAKAKSKKETPGK